MSHIIVLLRELLLVIHDRELENEVDVVQYSLLKDAIILVLKLAYYIESEEIKRGNGNE